MKLSLLALSTALFVAGPLTAGAQVVGIAIGSGSSALVATSGTERIVHVGDRYNGSRIAAISIHGVVLEDGRLLRPKPIARARQSTKRDMTVRMLPTYIAERTPAEAPAVYVIVQPRLYGSQQTLAYPFGNDKSATGCIVGDSLVDGPARERCVAAYSGIRQPEPGTSTPCFETTVLVRGVPITGCALNK